MILSLFLGSVAHADLQFSPSFCAVNKKDLGGVHVEKVFIGLFEDESRSFGGFQVLLSNGAAESYQMLDQTVTDQFIFYFDVAALPLGQVKSVIEVGVDNDAKPLSISGVSGLGPAFHADVIPCSL
jgi:hypothetical protein